MKIMGNWYDISVISIAINNVFILVVTILLGNTNAKVAEWPRGCLQSSYTPVQIWTLALEIPVRDFNAGQIVLSCVFAAIAAGQHPDPYRTRKLSPFT
jgi:hypothetical protein